MSSSESEYFKSDEVAKRDPSDHFEHERAAAYGDMRPVNVLIAGPTGAGKSTLTNAVLRKPVAKTGKGRPVTQDIEAWAVDGVPITVYDTPGLELDQKISDAAKRTVKFLKRQQKRPPEEQIHVFWYCSLAHERRIGGHAIAPFRRGNHGGARRGLHRPVHGVLEAQRRGSAHARHRDARVLGGPVQGQLQAPGQVALRSWDR
jgi:hypothetical protein